jgi:hypothetical protein
MPLPPFLESLLEHNESADFNEMGIANPSHGDNAFRVALGGLTNICVSYPTGQAIATSICLRAESVDLYITATLDALPPSLTEYTTNIWSLL